MGLAGLANGGYARSPRTAVSGSAPTSNTGTAEALTRALHLRGESKADQPATHTFQNATPRGAARRSADSTPPSSRPGSRSLRTVPPAQEARDEVISNAAMDGGFSHASSHGDGGADARQTAPPATRVPSSGSRAHSAKGSRSDGSPLANAKRLRIRPSTGGSRQPSPATRPPSSAEEGGYVACSRASPTLSRLGSAGSTAAGEAPPAVGASAGALAAAAGAAAAAAARALVHEAAEARAAAAAVVQAEAILLQHSLELSVPSASGSDGEGAERAEECAADEGGKEVGDDSAAGREEVAVEGDVGAGEDMSAERAKKGKAKVVKAKKKESVFLGYCSNTSVCAVYLCLRLCRSACEWCVAAHSLCLSRHPVVARLAVGSILMCRRERLVLAHHWCHRGNFHRHALRSTVPVCVAV